MSNVLPKITSVPVDDIVVNTFEIGSLRVSVLANQMRNSPTIRYTCTNQGKEIERFDSPEEMEAWVEEQLTHWPYYVDSFVALVKSTVIAMLASTV